MTSSSENKPAQNQRLALLAIILYIITTAVGFTTHSMGPLTIVYLLLGCGHIYWHARFFMLIYASVTTALYVIAYLINPDIIFAHADMYSFIIGATTFYIGSLGVVVFGKILFKTRSNEKQEKHRLHSLLSSTERQKKLLEENSLTKSNFFADFSHDIRTNINTICGMTELLSHQPSINTLEAEYIDTLQTATRSLLSTITDILDYSEIDSGRLELLHMKYNLFSCLQEIQNTILLDLNQDTISFLLHINPTMPYQFYGDEIRIRQVLLTLLSNSIYFTKCGYISIDVDYKKVDEDYGDIIMTITDTGATIPEEMKETLFSRYDVSNVKFSKDRPDVGLIVARKLANLMSGDLVYDSTNKKNSFIFTIRQEICTGFPYMNASSYDNCHILAYESNEYYAHAMRNMFDELQIRYRLYNSATELLNAVKDEPNTYVFFDYATGRNVLFESLAAMEHTVAVALIDIRTVPDATLTEKLTFLQKPLSFFNLIPILDKRATVSMENKKKTPNNFIAPEARILIIDDNRVNLRVAQNLVSSFKCDVTAVTSGREAISLIEQNEIYDIIFMDHMMPDLDGIETTRIIRDMPTPYAQQVPIIALTANTINGAKDLFIENDMNDFLPKPIEMSRLNKIMAEFIDDTKQIPIEKDET